MNAPATRAVASHWLAAVGMGLPWPVLLLLVDQTTGSPLALGLAAAARLLPYVAFSWLSGRLADRRERARIVRLSLWSRIALLLGVAVALHVGAVWWATALAVAAIVAGTPAYPALAAGMPRLAGSDCDRATALLVTAEVSSFVVGPALGGLLVGQVPAATAPVVGAAALGVATVLFGRTRMPAPGRVGRATEPGLRGLLAGAGSSGVGAVLRTTPSARQALVVVAAVNAVVAAVGLALLDLATGPWGGGAQAFGVATAVLGAGALGAPLVAGVPALRRPGSMLLVLAITVTSTAVLPPGPPVWAALAGLGAAATCGENVATATVQGAVADHVRASVLGLADSVMIGAALGASLVAPWLSRTWGPVSLLLLLAAATACLGLALGGAGSSSARHRTAFRSAETTMSVSNN